MTIIIYHNKKTTNLYQIILYKNFFVDVTTSFYNFCLLKLFGIKLISQIDIIIQYKIGIGTFGTVYKGTYNNQNIAIKIPNKLISQNLELNFKTELINLLHGLNCPYIVQLIGHCGFNIGLYQYSIILEYCNHGTLWDYIIRQMSNKYSRCRIPEALILLEDVRLGISFLHNKNIIHRDIKPMNIFIILKDISRLKAKIGDLGQCIDISVYGYIDNNWQGTPYYNAPEVKKHEQYDYTSDIYSFGRTAYELFSDGFNITLNNYDKLSKWIYPCLNLISKNRPSINELFFIDICKFNYNCTRGNKCWFIHSCD